MNALAVEVALLCCVYFHSSRPCPWFPVWITQRGVCCVVYAVGLHSCPQAILVPRNCVVVGSPILGWIA